MSQRLERQLEASLHERVDGLTESPLTVDDVRGRARRIRRNRVAVAGAGLAVAVALLVPAGMVAGGALERADEPLPATIAPSPVVEPVLLDTDAPRGESPQVAWTDGHFVHLPGGTNVRTELEYRDAREASGHVLGSWVDPDTGDEELHELAPDGGVLSATPVQSEAVVSDDGAMAAWQRRDGVLELLVDGARAELVTGLGPVRPVAIDGSTGAVWFDRVTEAGGAGRVDAGGTVTDPLPDVVAIGGVHDDHLVSATTKVDEMEPGSCGAVFEDGQELWSTCDHTLETFSPDGEWLLATDDYPDGAGQAKAAVLDATTGERLVQFEAGKGFIVHRVWEDNTHVLMTHYSYADRQWRVFRLGLDGSVEQTVSPRRGEDYLPPYGLAG